MNVFDFTRTKPAEIDPNLEYRPEKKLKDGKIYKGQWIIGTKTREGRGRLVTPKGSVYEGWFKDNKAHGRGLLDTHDKHLFDGFWKDDKLNGKGIHIWPDGRESEQG